MAEDKTMREAVNEVEMVGVVASKDFFFAKNDKGVNYVSGNIDIKVNDDIHRVAIKYTAEITKKGDENRAYKGLVTINEEVVTMEEDKEKATKVRLGDAMVTLNEYYKNGQLTSSLQTQTSFINRVKETEEFVPVAKFKLEMLVSGTVKEEKNEEETGRLILKGHVPGYEGKIFPVSLVVEGQKAVDYIEENYEEGVTVTTFGNIINQRLTIEKVVEVEFGEDQVDKSYKNTHEYKVTSGTAAKEFDADEDGNTAFNPKLLKKALAARTLYLEEKKAKTEAKDNKAGKSSSPFDKKDDKAKGNKVKVSESELPF